MSAAVEVADQEAGAGQERKNNVKQRRGDAFVAFYDITVNFFGR